MIVEEVRRIPGTRLTKRIQYEAPPEVVPESVTLARMEAERVELEQEHKEDQTAWAPLKNDGAFAEVLDWCEQAAEIDPPPAGLRALLDPESVAWLAKLQRKQARLAELVGQCHKTNRRLVVRMPPRKRPQEGQGEE